jgi:tRNA G18 (ribose-2'-O)-methylase SpoU
LRHREHTFVIEGALAVRRLFEAGWPVASVMLRPEKLEAMADVAASAETAGVPVYLAERDVFDRTAGYPVHRGVLALAPRPVRQDPGELARRVRGPIVVLEAINDQENLGAIFRNAAVLGAGAVLMDRTCCDPLYRRAVRVSLGHVMRIPFARLDPFPDGLRLLAEEGFTVVALSPGADLTIAEVARADRPALLVGAEGPGLSPP